MPDIIEYIDLLHLENPNFTDNNLQIANGGHSLIFRNSILGQKIVIKVLKDQKNR